MNVARTVSAYAESIRRRVQGGADGDATSAKPAIVSCIEELVKNAVAAKAKHVAVTYSARELRVVDDGEGIRDFSRFMGAGEGLRRAAMALTKLPTMLVTSTNTFEKNSATIDAKFRTSTGHNVDRVVSGGHGASPGVGPIRLSATGQQLPRGTDIAIRPVTVPLADASADEIQRTLAATYPAVAITVTRA